MRFGGIDHVVAVIAPVMDQRLDQRRRMLSIAVDEQHRAEPGVIEAGEQRRLLAEIARQRDQLNIERRGRQLVSDGKRIVAAAIVDIDHFAGEPVLGIERARHLGERGMEPRQRRRFVMHGNDHGETGRRGRRSTAPLAHRSLAGWSRRTRLLCHVSHRKLLLPAIYTIPGHSCRVSGVAGSLPRGRCRGGGSP